MQNERILISVVIPSYNRSNIVIETIESIIAQEGQGVSYNLEIIIGDDCSTDNTREILFQYREKYPDLIRLIFHEQNIGLGANWATCIKACKGRYICNCDNDDYWHNTQKLLLQLNYFETHPQANVLITNHRSHNRDTGVIVEEKAFISRDKPLQHAIWGDGKTHFCNATIMYRADFLKLHLNLDEFIKRQFTLQDWTAWVILAAYTDFDIIPVSTATFGVETTSITRPNSMESYLKRLNGDKEICKYLGELFPNEFPYDEEETNRYIKGRLVALAFALGDYESAKLYVSNATGISFMKKICAHSRTLFRFFCVAKSIKNRFS